MSHKTLQTNGNFRDNVAEMGKKTHLESGGARAALLN